jgi:predicted metal-binding protein
MGKIKLGIITCSNATRTLDCPAGACLKDLHEFKGSFKQYNDIEVELAGVISCNGCPTITGAEIISPRIESLIHYGATVIHLSYCMKVLCPFVKKYYQVMMKSYPKIKFVIGTHEPHQTDHEFKCDIMNKLIKRRTLIMP